MYLGKLHNFLKEVSKLNTYKSIVKGLNEAIEYEKGNLENVRKKKYRIIPPANYESEDIREIRNKLNMSQRIFAELMGISVKTVEAWESGRNTPSGPAQRMLGLFKEDSTLADKFVLVKEI